MAKGHPLRLYTLTIFCYLLAGNLYGSEVRGESSLQDVIIGDAFGIPGYTTSMMIGIHHRDTLAGFQFSLPTGVTEFGDLTANPGEQLLSDTSWKIYTNLTPENEYIMLGFDNDLAGVPPGSHEMLKIDWVLRDGIVAGIYPLWLKNGLIADIRGVAMPARFVEGRLAVSTAPVLFTCQTDTFNMLSTEQQLNIMLASRKAVTACRFDLIDSADIFQVSGIRCGTEADWRGEITELGDGTARITLIGSEGSLLKAFRIIKITVFTQLDSQAVAGNYPVRFANIILTDVESDTIEAQAVDGRIVLNNQVLDPFGLIGPASGSYFRYSGGMADSLRFRWYSSRSPLDLPLKYALRFGIYGAGEIGSPFPSDNAGRDTILTIAAAELYESLTLSESVQTDSLYFYWYVIADDGQSRQASADIFEFVLFNPTAIRQGELRPKRFNLSQNHPNPFNSETRIQYSLPRRVSVRLDIYNLLGHRITTLADELQGPGTYQVRWAGRNAAGISLESGVYFYTLQAGHFCRTRKMVILK